MCDVESRYSTVYAALLWKSQETLVRFVDSQTLTGIANPTPADVPLAVRIASYKVGRTSLRQMANAANVKWKSSPFRAEAKAVFTPMTLPAASRRGPPELPGNINELRYSYSLHFITFFACCHLPVCRLTRSHDLAKSCTVCVHVLLKPPLLDWLMHLFGCILGLASQTCQLHRYTRDATCPRLFFQVFKHRVVCNIVIHRVSSLQSAQKSKARSLGCRKVKHNLASPQYPKFWISRI